MTAPAYVRALDLHGDGAGFRADCEWDAEKECRAMDAPDRLPYGGARSFVAGDGRVFDTGTAERSRDHGGAL